MEKTPEERLRHDVGNALSIARSIVDAMLDGVVDITPARLHRLRDLLASVSDSISVPAQAFPLPTSMESDADIIATGIAELAPLAKTKGVELVHDALDQDTPLQTLLLHVLREAPPQSTVHVQSAPQGVVVVTVRLSD